MNKFLLFLFIFSALSCLVLLGFLFGGEVYQKWGRRLVYSSASKITLNPGSGKITRAVEAQIFILPKGMGRPFFDSPNNKSNYSPETYDVIDIPAQNQLLYAVGVFAGWQDIDGTLDKYLLVREPSSKTVEEFRVSFEPSDLFKDEITTLGVENVEFRFKADGVNAVEKANENNIISLTYGVVSKIIRNGDAVILIPVLDPPELAKKDETGNHLASRIIVRRIGGSLGLNWEINRILTKK